MISNFVFFSLEKGQEESTGASSKVRMTSVNDKSEDKK